MKEFAPPKGVLIPFTERDVGFEPRPGEKDMRDSVKVIGGQKFFEDPHYIGFSLRKSSVPESRTFMKWTLDDPDPTKMLHSLKDVLAQGDYENGTGTMVLENLEAERARELFLPTNVTVRTIFGAGTIHLEGDAVDIAAEVLAHPERISLFSLSNRQLSIWWGTSWPTKYHDIHSHEVTLREIEPGALTRFVVDQCVSFTAGMEIKQSVDQTLDEMSAYIPSLAN